MSKPHKNAEVLRALADGRTIQFYSPAWGEWLDWENKIAHINPAHVNPVNNLDYYYEWRIKPEVLKYRVAVLNCELHIDEKDKLYTDTVNTKQEERLMSLRPDFVKWIHDDWQEIER